MTMINSMILGCALFLTGLAGVLRHRAHIISLLLGIEVMLLGATTLFVSMAWIHQNVAGHVIALLVLASAAAESAVGLALFVLFFRTFRQETGL